MIFLHLNNYVNCFDLSIIKTYYFDKKIFEVDKNEFKKWCDFHQFRIEKRNNCGKVTKILMRNWFEFGEVWDSLFEYENM